MAENVIIVQSLGCLVLNDFTGSTTSPYADMAFFTMGAVLYLVGCVNSTPGCYPLDVIAELKAVTTYSAS